MKVTRNGRPKKWLKIISNGLELKFVKIHLLHSFDLNDVVHIMPRFKNNNKKEIRDIILNAFELRLFAKPQKGLGGAVKT